MSENQKNKQINIELSDEVAEGIYSNLAILTHSHSEFIVDFVKMMPGVPKAKVKSRIILTPQHAKRLFRALKDNIAKFESIHGAIKESETENMPFSLGGPTAQA
jgi:translation initiation factor 2B subunit (eIF-2B alpha/beta/delta family)